MSHTPPPHLHRYWSVMAPLRYLRRRTRRRASLLLAVAWAAATLWLVPVLAWRPLSFGENTYRRVTSQCETDFAHNITFKLITSVLNFYLPSLLIVALYYKIYKSIKKRTLSFPRNTECKSIQDNVSSCSEATNGQIHSASERTLYKTTLKTTLKCDKKLESQSDTQLYNNLKVIEVAKEECSKPCWYEGVTVQVEYLSDRSHHMHHRACFASERTNTNKLMNVSSCGKQDTSPGSSREYTPNCKTNKRLCASPALTLRRTKSTNLSLVKDTKAARQLGFIMGVFLACWLPYFTIFPVIALCNSCIPSSAHIATISLGYLNSALNPAIYPLCNHHFRRAFSRMLSCKKSSFHE